MSDSTFVAPDLKAAAMIGVGTPAIVWAINKFAMSKSMSMTDLLIIGAVAAGTTAVVPTVASLF